MVQSSVATEFQLLFTLLIHTSSAGTHSLKYFYTGVREMNLTEFTAVGMVDGGQFSYYDSNIKKAIPKTKWIKKVGANDPDYWNSETKRCQVDEEIFKASVATVIKRFHQTEGVHVLQRMYGCKLDDNGTTSGYDQYGYDGEDFISLDLKTITWTAANAKAVMTKLEWDSDAVWTKNYLENECIFWLRKYVSYGRETLERKVRPEASVFQKNFPQPELVCHATGFFPSGLMMSWQKDGEELHEDVEIRETLPNHEGSFQKRAVLRVSPEELKEHEYTCVVQHSSLEKDLVLKAPGGVPLGIIVGAVVAVLALVALIVAGVVIYKKKNSGFKPVPAKPNSSSEKDSENSSSTSTMPSTSANDAPEKDSEHRSSTSSSSSNDSDAASIKNKSLTCRDRGADGGGEMKSCTDYERGVGDTVLYFNKPHQIALRRYVPIQLCCKRL